jgi:hypothetical protein
VNDTRPQLELKQSQPGAERFCTSPHPVVTLLSMSLPFPAFSTFVHLLKAFKITIAIFAHRWSLGTRCCAAIPGTVCGHVNRFRDCSRGDRLPSADAHGTVLAEGHGVCVRRNRVDRTGCSQP